MKKNLLIFLLVCGTLYCNRSVAQYLHYSDIRISLLTAAPGQDLYAVFGHNGIRVKIDNLGYDIVYNYGTFTFNEPYFYIKFARGWMNYYLSVNTYDKFMSDYMYENRKIREQVFELDSIQTMFMLSFLENNARPENRYYWYNFFLDNCATRIRDLVQETFPDLPLPETLETPTYRELINRYLGEHPWGRFWIDIALGLPTDQKTNLYEQMFLPDYLFEVYSRMLYNGRPIIKETTDVFIPTRPAIKPAGPITPAVVCFLILALAFLFVYVRKGARLFDFILFFTVGITGILVVFLWFFSIHIFTGTNLNIIWALPTHVVMAFFLLRRERNNFTRKYFLITAIIAMLLVVSWVFMPQRLNPALIPFVLAIALRAFRIYRL